MRCSICGEELTNRPTVQGSVAGVSYCPQHAEYSSLLKDAHNFSCCPVCDLKYSEAHSTFAATERARCPNCGSPLGDPRIVPEIIRILGVSRNVFYNRVDETLETLGGTDAFHLLIAMLELVPDPPYLVPEPPHPPRPLGFDFRINVVRLLGALRDPRAVAPLADCYETYMAHEELLLGHWQDQQRTIPHRYFRINELYEQYGADASLTTSPRVRAFNERIGRTHLANIARKSPEMPVFLGRCVREEVVRALGKIKTEEVGNILANILDREHVYCVRDEAALALGEMGDPRSIDALAEGLLAKESESSWHFYPPTDLHVIDLLSSFADEKAYRALMTFCRSCLHDRNWELRSHCLARLRAHPQGAGDSNLDEIQRMLWRATGYCEVCGKALGLVAKVAKRARCNKCR